MWLLIVESPTKAATLAGFLGPTYRVRATEGHVCDLPDEGLGVDVDGAFEAQWRTAKGKRNVLAALRRDAEGCDRILLATDPDREGEAIAHHLAEALARTKVPAARVAFGEVTEEAVRAAVARPRPLDAGLVAAQQARRVVDRLVGYAVSPHLQRAVRSPRPLSAGRVQTSALRLLCEHEHALADFAPTPMWGVEAVFQTESGDVFSARLVRAHGQPLHDGALDEGAAWQLAEAAMLEPYAAGSVRRTSQRLLPPPPFTTASLLQAASEQLGLRPAEALRAAQQLYEGVELEDDVRVGLLTYPRTDGVRLTLSAVAAIRHVIARDLGTEYLPDRPPTAPAKEAGRPQEAHEAIRPVAFERTPKSVRKYLTPVQYRLYRLVYQRAVASQAIPAVLERTEVESADPGGRFVFRASGARVTARGFLQIEGAEPETSALPAMLGKGERLATVRIAQAKRMADPPERYTEAALVGAMEARGIGRPSTYAATLETLVDRGYAVIRDRRLYPTDLGLRTCAFLVGRFPALFDLGFTARLETTLDAVASGREAYTTALHQFYHGRLLPALQRPADPAAGAPNRAAALPDAALPCERCGRPMLRRDGPHGAFYGCSNFPACRNTRPFVDLTSAPPCPRCETGRLVERTTRQGRRFYGCSAYPACDYAQSEAPRTAASSH